MIEDAWAGPASVLSDRAHPGRSPGRVEAGRCLREGIEELIHPSATSSFAVAYVVLAISTVFDLVSFRRSAGQMARQALE